MKIPGISILVQGDISLGKPKGLDQYGDTTLDILEISPKTNSEHHEHPYFSSFFMGKTPSRRMILGRLHGWLEPEDAWLSGLSVGKWPNLFNKTP